MLSSLGRPVKYVLSTVGRSPSRRAVGVALMSMLSAACGAQSAGSSEEGKRVDAASRPAPVGAKHDVAVGAAAPAGADGQAEVAPGLPAGLVTEASQWQVRTKQSSYWHNLAPWAFWSVEAARPRVLVELGSHHGYSYFAFAQAIERLGLGTQAFAVDTWRGDEHAGAYDETVYREFVECNQKYYASFSTPLRMTFDDALAHIADGSVDLLHIDGQHFYEDVHHDFYSWRPKLSDRAVVLFHDIDVTCCGFGVYRFWAEISQQYPSFAFHQEAGLGILGVGPNLPAGFKTLFDLKDPQHIAELEKTYRALGDAANAYHAPVNCAAASDG